MTTSTKTVMMNTNINLIIESIDVLGEKSIERVQAVKKIESDKIFYSYESEIGRCEFLISSDYLKMTRSGEANLKLEINSTGEGIMTYSTMGFHKEFEIKNATLNLSSGNIAFSYDIMEGDELINTLTIRVWEEQ